MVKSKSEPLLGRRSKIGSATRVTERGSRTDDKAGEAAMGDRKKAGYF